MSNNTSILPPQDKKEYSQSENLFVEWINKRYPNIEVSKKGMPDFMLIKDGKIVGFVEVKRDQFGKSDKLRPHQQLFNKFCRDNDIPYQVWRPYDFQKRNRISESNKRRRIHWYGKKNVVASENNHKFYSSVGGVIKWNNL